jgi:Flp pilus assembly protein TadD
VSKKRNVSLALALVLSACIFAPQSALGKRVLYDAAPFVGATPAQPEPFDAAVAAGGDSQQSKHTESGLARALAAPFRALARLFGGGSKKSKAEEARKAAPRPASSDAAGLLARADAKPENASAPAATQSRDAKPELARTAEMNETNVTNGTKKSPLASEQEASALARGIVSGAPTAEQQQGARIVRPADPAAAAPTPGMWIPVIEGISKDPLTQGRALLEHGYLQESIAELTVAAAQVGPGLVEANNLLGLAYDRLGWHTLAAEAYGRALTVAPKDAAVLANLGYSLYLADDYNGALLRLKQAARLAPGTPVINNDLGIVEARVRRYDDAFKYFAAASNEYDAHLKLATILEEQKRDRDAIKHYEAALRLQPGTSAILERLVALYERMGEHDKADQARRTLGQPKNSQKTTTGGG